VFHQVRGMLKFDRAEWRPLRVTLDAYLEWLARALARAPRVRGMRASNQRELASMLFGAISGVTSVRAASGWPPARSAAADSLVESLVAMATACVSARDGSGAHRMTSARSNGGGLMAPSKRPRDRASTE
jgi:hypothetical protein